MRQPKPVELSPIDIAMLKREHIDWEKEDVREMARNSVRRHLSSLRGQLWQMRAERDFWRTLFLVLASGVAFVIVFALVKTLFFEV